MSELQELLLSIDNGLFVLMALFALCLGFAYFLWGILIYISVKTVLYLVPSLDELFEYLSPKVGKDALKRLPPSNDSNLVNEKSDQKDHGDMDQ